MKTDIELFNNLVENLIKNDYNIVIHNVNGYLKAEFNSNHVQGYFCQKATPYCEKFDGRIVFDNRECFDKISRCPFNLR